MGHIIGAEAGLSKEFFVERLRLFYKCVKATVMNADISIKSKTVRRLIVGDVLEALAAPGAEEGSNVKRVRCKVVGGDAEGYVTIAGNQGTTFLEIGGNV